MNVVMQNRDLFLTVRMRWDLIFTLTPNSYPAVAEGRNLSDGYQ
jgi:hypothetical protein